MVAIPIVGMGGVGKTTLARAAFDDPAVIHHFDVRRWVTVSQVYNSRAILQAILDDKSSNETASLQDLSVKVHQLLKRRRYIIIVDDIWSVDDWDGFKRFIPNDNNGSRVLVSTRNENVASYAAGSSTAIHHLSLMDKEKSWRLLEETVFGEGACCPPELVEFGETIAQGCKGLPLAIVVIAGILSNINQNPDSWKRIVEDVHMTLSKESEQFSEILSLSYHHLPHFLKSCFLYFAAYPEDYIFHVSKIVKLWVADGFVKPKPTKLVEEIAYGCLEELTKRNLVMVTKKRYNGDIKTCQIHDLLRKFCIKQAQEEQFIYHVEDKIELLVIFEGGTSKPRRISVGSGVSTHPMYPGKCSVHAALCYNPHRPVVNWLIRCRLLRGLDISTSEYCDLPLELFQLYHLRYLEFTLNFEVSSRLPKNICDLENLESLIAKPRFVNNDEDKVILPLEFWTMKSLRHVIMYPYVVLPDPIFQGFPLENLLTLSRLHNFRCTEEVVKLIPNVRKIEVWYELDIQKENWYDYELNNFGRFNNLESLRVGNKMEGYELDWCEKNPFLKCLILPSSLRRLCIQNSAASIAWEDVNDALGSLPNLESLKLWSCFRSGGVWEMREGNFQNLRSLSIGFCHLKCWIIESQSHFPNLEKLCLSYCFNLTELSDCIGDIWTLQLIKIDNCLEDVDDWARRIREEQLDIGNELLNIEVEQLGQLRDLKKEDKFAKQLAAFYKRLNLSEEEGLYLVLTDQLVEEMEFLGDDRFKLSPEGMSILYKADMYYYTDDGDEMTTIEFADFSKDLKSYVLEHTG